jgi:glutaredoxin
MEVIFYTTHCPQCSILSKKLDAKNIQYTTVDDVEVMKELGITSVPVLSVGGVLMNFRNAVDFVNSLEA